MSRRSLLCGLFLGVVAAHGAFPAAHPALRPPAKKSFNKNDEVIPGIVVVKFMPGVDFVAGSRVTNSAGVNHAFVEQGVISLVRSFRSVGPLSEFDRAKGNVDLSRVYDANIDSDRDPRDVAAELSNVGGIEYAEPKYMHYLNDIPNDPQLSSQTNSFTRMNAFNGWTIAKGSPNVVIAVVDGGTYWRHEDLFGNLRLNSAEDINGNGQFDPSPPPTGDLDGIDQNNNGFVDDVIGWNFANNASDPQGVPGAPGSGNHGTNTASVFGAVTNNNTGMAGSSWNCSLLPICAASPTSDFMIPFGFEGIVYAYSNGAHVINCSWSRTGGYSAFEQDIVTAATQAGALIVAAAGNGTNNNGFGKNNDFAQDYPAGYNGVLSVGATSPTSDIKASFSNYGITVPVYAPGVSITVAESTGGYSQSFLNSGTSYSSPFVAGLAGILKSLHPTWTPRQIAMQIRVTSDSIDAVNPTFAGNLGRGRVNFARALSESHPGIEITDATIHNSRGSNLFLHGDTIVATVEVKNILFTDAVNLTFTATTSDASLQVVEGSANIPLLRQGQRVTLPVLRFMVGPLTVAKDVVIKLQWVSNTNDRDAHTFKATLFPSTPLWEPQTSSTTISLFSVKAVDKNVGWAAGGNSSGTAPVVIRTLDGGAQWRRVTENLPKADLYCITALDKNRAWVGTGDGKIFATTNGGDLWVEQVYPGTQSPFINGIWMFNNNVGYAQGDPASGDRFIVLRTTNGGQTWAHLANEPVGVSGEFGWNNSFWWTDENHGWFGTNKSKVWRTTDGGLTWSSAASGAANSYGVAFKDNVNGVVGHSNGSVRVTTDGGASWSAVGSPTGSEIRGVSYPTGTSSVWVADLVKPYHSTNDGAAWTSQTTYPFNGFIFHISFFDTSSGWAVTSNGEVLRYSPAVPVGVGAEPWPQLPAQYALLQNFPNPFNPTTRIRYTLPVSGYVTIKVYDLLGRNVATLVDEFQTAGEKFIDLDAGGLSSGVYFYQMKAGEFTDTEKLVILR